MLPSTLDLSELARTHALEEDLLREAAAQHGVDVNLVVGAMVLAVEASERVRRLGFADTLASMISEAGVAE